MRDKTFERRFVFCLVWIIAGFFMVKAALGAEEASQSTSASKELNPPSGQPQQAEESGQLEDKQIPWPDAYRERGLPFQREISPEDAEWLGHVVWESMQKIVPKNRNRGLSSGEIHALVLEMRRNRGEFNVQLEDLLRILSTRSKQCGRRDLVETNEQASVACSTGSKPAPGQAWGFDLDRLKPPRN